MTHLHLHTHIGSRLDGIASSEEYAERAKRFGHKALAVTDHGKLSSFFEHQQACKKFDIKPIFGVEQYITDRLVTNEIKAGKEKRVRGINYHLILLAKNEIGYKNILKLNYISMKDEEHFYYFNRITLDELIEHKDGIIITTGCMNSPINRRIREGKTEEAKKIFDRLYNEFGEDFYGEIQLNEFSKAKSESGEQELCNAKIIEWSEEKNVTVVTGGDVHYLEKGQDTVQTISIAIRNKTDIDNLSFEIESKNLYFHDLKDYIDFNKDFGYGYTNEQIIKWVSNTDLIANKCNYEIPERDRIYLPNITEDDDSALITKSIEGLCKIFNVKELKDVSKEYSDQLKKELEIIIRKGFASYLLILEDAFRFAEECAYYRGPSRGSAGGSLVCYALGITTLDPIKYNLIFERFISEARSIDMVYDYYIKD